MGALLERLNIAVRIYLLIGIAALGIIGVILISANSIEDSLTNDRNDQTRRLVETAHSLASSVEARGKAGEFSMEDAKKRALVALSALRYDGDQYFWVNDWDGKMLAHGTHPELVGQTLLEKTDAKGSKIYVDFINIAKNKGGGVYSYYWPDASGATKPKISYVKGMADWQWVIGSGVFADDISEAVWQVEKKLGMAAFILLIIVALMATYIGNTISNPVRFLTRVMERLADGDLSVNIGMETRRDEIGNMAKALETFKSNAIEMKRLQGENEAQKKRAAEEQRTLMMKTADDFEKSVKGVVATVSSAATEMQSNAASMAAISEETSRQSTAAAAATEQASSNVHTVASAAEELNASIGEINRQIGDSVHVAAACVKEAENTGAVMQSLDKAAENIGSVVKLIEDIASQVNLLALNATIEAARAGEAGRGFAVVATEVKNLANQTTNAAQGITKEISEVQNQAKAAVNAIEGITNTIKRVNEISTTIASAVEEQGAATKEIARNVQQATEGTDEVARNISGVSRAAQETGTASSQVLDAASQLAKESEMLHNVVDAFITKIRTA
jgi:methyl-accepting chemotaxis protein